MYNTGWPMQSAAPMNQFGAGIKRDREDDRGAANDYRQNKAPMIHQPMFGGNMGGVGAGGPADHLFSAMAGMGSMAGGMMPGQPMSFGGDMGFGQSFAMGAQKPMAQQQQQQPAQGGFQNSTFMQPMQSMPNQQQPQQPQQAQQQQQAPQPGSLQSLQVPASLFSQIPGLQMLSQATQGGLSQIPGLDSNAQHSGSNVVGPAGSGSYQAFRPLAPLQQATPPVQQPLQLPPPQQLQFGQQQQQQQQQQYGQQPVMQQPQQQQQPAPQTVLSQQPIVQPVQPPSLQQAQRPPVQQQTPQQPPPQQQLLQQQPPQPQQQQQASLQQPQPQQQPQQQQQQPFAAGTAPAGQPASATPAVDPIAQLQQQSKVLHEALRMLDQQMEATAAKQVVEQAAAVAGAGNGKSTGAAAGASAAAAPLPDNATDALYLDALPADVTRREMAHIFRPLAGFQGLRLVQKEPANARGEHLHRLFVDFEDAAAATAAIKLLNGYPLDLDDERSYILRPVYGRPPKDRTRVNVGVLGGGGSGAEASNSQHRTGTVQEARGAGGQDANRRIEDDRSGARRGSSGPYGGGGGGGAPAAGHVVTVPVQGGGVVAGMAPPHLAFLPPHVQQQVQQQQQQANPSVAPVARLPVSDVPPPLGVRGTGGAGYGATSVEPKGYNRGMAPPGFAGNSGVQGQRGSAPAAFGGYGQQHSQQRSAPPVAAVGGHGQVGGGHAQQRGAQQAADARRGGGHPGDRHQMAARPRMDQGRVTHRY